jgi:predicted alpha/beta hydrolase family esterase
MKRAIIVHCWEGYPGYCWYPWVKEKLEQGGFKVLVPAFPETKTPKQKKWVPYLAEQIGLPDDKLFLIGHSVGCITILRYLETLREKQRVGGVVLVAGFTDDLGFKELANFF